MQGILLRHFQLMRENSPEESCHVMDAGSLHEAGVVLLGVRNAGNLLAVGGLKTLTPDHAELKSMHTISEARGQGVAGILLGALIAHAKASGISQISLETGSAQFFKPAQQLYTSQGFMECPPFGDYQLDPLSLFMTRKI